jgi:hypothetical protein
VLLMEANQTAGHRAHRAKAIIWGGTFLGIMLNVTAVSHAGESTPSTPLEVWRGDQRGTWFAKVVPPAGVDWLPRPNWRPLSSTDLVRGGYHAADGRLVSVLDDDLPYMVVDGQEQYQHNIGPLHLVTLVATGELCAGPIEIALAGVNAVGEETVLRVKGEVTDPRWLRKHCKAKG